MLTVSDAPATRSTRRNAARWRNGLAGSPGGGSTYTCTTSLPVRSPVFVTSTLTVTPSSIPPSTRAAPSENVVYPSP